VQYAEAVTVLRGIDIFGSLDPANLKLLAFSSTYLTLEDNEVLFCEGDPADSVYLIDEGEADICIGRDENEVKVAKMGKHGLVGEMAIFRNAPRSATIRAAGSLKVLKIDAEMFLRVVTENPNSALAVMRILSEKLAVTTESYERLKGMAPLSTNSKNLDA
jgi:CRP-like cAMP-binding protein